MKKTNDQTDQPKKSAWFQNTLLGMVLLVFGILFKFFPTTASSIIFTILGIVLLFVGITDAITAKKYKDDDDDWKTPMIVGVISIIASILLVAAYWLRIPNFTNVILIAFAVWGILRCILLLVSIVRGKITQKGRILSALITGVMGILILIFKNAILVSSDMVGWVLMALGIIMTFLGLYQRADKREKKEKEARDKKAEKQLAKKQPPTESPTEPLSGKTAADDVTTETPTTQENEIKKAD